MNAGAQQLALLLDSIDNTNKNDPNTELCDGISMPKEYLYSIRMTEQLLRFSPKASYHLQIAARAQHIERWRSPRQDYPEGRAGYKKWRSQLLLFHATRVGELMTQAGYNESDIARVQYLIKKRKLRSDPETQTLEDVICLVFLDYYLDDFAQKHPRDKLIDIIQKTWKKMSSAAQSAALLLDFQKDIADLLQDALQQ